MPNIHLVVNYFKHENEVRAREIDLALKLNIQNQKIDRIHLLIDGEPPSIKHEKIKIRKNCGRTSYQDMLSYIGSEVDNNEIAIISNADISFDATIEEVKKLANRGTCLALTRYNKEDGKWVLQRSIDSQDCWIFKTPIKHLEDTSFHLGMRGCDNRFAAILGERYKVRNPAKTVKCYHHHSSNIRTLSPIVPGKKAHVRPC